MLNKVIGFAAIGLALGMALPAEAGTLKLAHSTWVGYGPFYIARDKGFFKDEGVDVDLTVMEDTPAKMGALQAGQVDLVASTVDEFPIYMPPGKTLRYIMAVDNSKGGDGIVARKDIKSITDLKGKKVAFETGSVSQFFFNAILKQAGMSENDVEVVNMTATDAGVAFVAGQVDAAVTWEPALSQGANSANGHLLLSSADKPGLITDVVAVTPETAATHQADLKAFVRAWYRALEFIKTNPDEANQIMASGVGGWLADPVVFKQTLAGIEYLDKSANQTFFGSSAAPGQISKTLGYALDIWSEKGRIQAKIKPDDLIDYGFVGG
ncbi:ABC transporter substrate-binding protein [Mesorhizobium shangrilense]|uniref:ABC transporter substrate-binding protein n=1 Tax=Mesorhizobium shangrilense TaxID=460060 RepID=A0ABV2DFU8_9HYPH